MLANIANFTFKWEWGGSGGVQRIHEKVAFEENIYST